MAQISNHTMYIFTKVKNTEIPRNQTRGTIHNSKSPKEKLHEIRRHDKGVSKKDKGMSKKVRESQG